MQIIFLPLLQRAALIIYFPVALAAVDTGTAGADLRRFRRLLGAARAAWTPAVAIPRRAPRDRGAGLDVGGAQSPTE